jgi:single-stranded DNA-specific DHH superfamily exonuclease
MIIYNGQEDNNKDILLEKWGLEQVYSGEQMDDKPALSLFKNTACALELLHKHIVNDSRIVFHTDVDMDGFGSTYILKKFCEYLGSNNHILMINKEKEHGIMQKHADFFKIRQCADLMIITDSSTNNLNIIKQFNCDVLVIDHHELEHEEPLVGLCNDGIHRYVIVNNTIDNDSIEQDKAWALSNLKNKNYIRDIQEIASFKHDRNMSCAVVIYEILRVYAIILDKVELLENSKLIQWAGITLFTDVIDTLNERNQWYLDNTLMSTEVEVSLKIMMNQLNKFKYALDKTYIQYTFAPLINKAIRASKGSEALDIVINRPYEITKLKAYAKLQNDAIDKAIYIEEIDELSREKVKTARKFESNTIVLDTTSLDIHKNYNGVMAGRLSGDNHKSSAVFKQEADGLCKGSFRGVCKEVDYRQYFLDFDNNVKAQGHPGAFGFELKYEQLISIMNSISSIEKTNLENNKVFLTVGNMSPSEYGVYHIDDVTAFKRNGYVLKIATGNSKVITIDEILIRIRSSDIDLVDMKQTSNCTVYTYSAMGIKCKAFQEIKSAYCDIYLEFTNQIDAYIRNV